MKKLGLLLLLIFTFITAPRALASEVELSSGDDVIQAETISKYTVQEKNDMRILFTCTGVFIIIIAGLTIVEIKRMKRE